MMNSVEPFAGYGGPMRSNPYGRMYGSLDFDDVSLQTCFVLPCLQKRVILFLKIEVNIKQRMSVIIMFLEVHFLVYC